MTFQSASSTPYFVASIRRFRTSTEPKATTTAVQSFWRVVWRIELLSMMRNTRHSVGLSVLHPVGRDVDMVGSHIGCFEGRLVSFNDRTLLPPVPPRTRNCICFMLVNLEQLKRSSLSWPLDLPPYSLPSQIAFGDYLTCSLSI